MEEKNVQAENSNQQEEEVLETSSETEEGEQNNTAELDEAKAKLAKAEELANNYKVRAEKAEKLARSVKTEQPKASPPAGEINTKDLYALMDAKVPQEDIDEVVEYAKFKKISVGEALKSNVVKTMLSENAEMRTTAQAANVGGSKRSSGKVSEDTLLANAAKGILPDNDADLERMIRARKGYKN